MKKVIPIVLMAIGGAILAENSNAQSREIGIIIGEPTGLSAKFWTSGRTAVDFGVAWSFSGSGSMHLHSNYLLHFWIQSGTAFYLGFGGRMLIKDTPEIAARIPLGLQVNLAGGRLALFFEGVPMLAIYPDTGNGFDVNGGLGIRFRF
jgi:hypothetical protein